MKKIALLLGTLLFLSIAILFTTYKVRKNDSGNQYVSEQSATVLTISIDDLILNNLSHFITFKSTSSSDSLGKSDLKRNFLWSSGIPIPSQAFLFSLPEKEDILYGITAVKKFDKCFSFFADNFPETIEFLDKENEIVRVIINEYLQLVFNRSHLVYAISLNSESDIESLRNILEQPKSWTKIKALSDFNGSLSNEHLTYIRKDQVLTLSAQVSSNKIEVHGHWKLSRTWNEDLKVRTLDSSNQTLRFWSLLDLEETPAILSLLTKFTGISSHDIHEAQLDYVDIQVTKNLIAQKESAITYTYDSDFNEIEQKIYTDKWVPEINVSLIANPSLMQTLPTTLFYQFHTYRVAPYLISTTQVKEVATIRSKKTTTPLYFNVNFSNWPEPWESSFTNYLKANKVHAEIKTSKVTETELEITAEVLY